MDVETAWDVLAGERRAFADLLETLTPEQWGHPSLCGEWTVREVVAHMMAGPTGSMLGFAKEMLLARGRFDEANRRIAAKRAERPTAVLVGEFRSHAGHRFSPPGMDWHAPWTDFLIHRLDVIVPLGIDSGRPSGAWPTVLEFLVGPKATGVFTAKDLPALTYAATDVAWSHGDGPRVEARAEVLALALSGRSALLADLTGPGATVLADWVSVGSRRGE